MKGTALCASVLLACFNLYEGHLYVMVPPSRPLLCTESFPERDCAETEYKPQAFYSGNTPAVRARGDANIDPALRELYGGQAGRQWPLRYLYDAGIKHANGNFYEPEGIAIRHGICGDPGKGRPEGDNTYGAANSDFPVTKYYTNGSVIEIKTVTTIYHWGHLEFFLCDAKDLDDPDGPVTQECLNKYPLSRAPDDEYNGPIDPDHMGRYFVDPPCRATETDQTYYPEYIGWGQVSTMRYMLPESLICERCIMQMIYYTGDKCIYPGYREFNPTSLPNGCANSKDDWINPSTDFPNCGDVGGYPQEFWNCADISIY